jgi:hypothetical protein
MQDTEITSAIELAKTLTSFDVVSSEDDFFISLNGQVLPSECTGYSIDENKCFVLHQEAGDVVTFPIPEFFQSYFMETEKILFVRFMNGEVFDANELSKEEYHVH